MNWLKGLLQGSWFSSRDGPRLFLLAPLIPLLAIVPEAAQHVLEFKLGMFASMAAFKAHQMDHLRWAFGIPKLIAYWIAIFSAAVWWAGRFAPKDWRQGILWKRLGLALMLNAALAFAGIPLDRWLTPTASMVVGSIMLLAWLPALIYLFGALFGDHAMTLRQSYRSGWLKLPAIVLYGCLAVLVPQRLHHFDHTLAMGKPSWMIFTLMSWDALWVGLMACWLGAAIAHGYGLGRDHSPPSHS